MTILLSSANTTVTTRWTEHLRGHYKTRKAKSLTEVKKLCVTGRYELILLHRMLIDIPAFSELYKLSPASGFFLLSDRPDEKEALIFLKLGILGYGNTYMSSPRLLEALRVVLNGGVWLGQKVIQRLIADTATGSTKVSDDKDIALLEMAKLTKAERQIAELVARGESNLSIAADLNITERTVKAHLTSIYSKTKTGNRLNLALLINLGKSPQE